MSPVMTLCAIVPLVATTSLAWAKGTRAEQYGASAVLVMWTISAVTWRVLLIFHLPDFKLSHLYIDLIGDALMSIAFLLLAIRYASWWLGIAMLVEALQFGLIAHFLQTDSSQTSPHAQNVFILQANLISYTVLVILVGGTCASWHSQVLRKRREAELLANPPPEPFAWVGTAALMKGYDRPLADRPLA